MRVLACLLVALMGTQAVERLRLADGPHGCAGRLEVWHGGRWGTVCDDGWDLRDAAVACRELGCGGALAAPGGAFFGEGAGPVWLSELACRGGERQLGLCPHRGWKAHICSHEEDAGVVCAGQRGTDSRDRDDPPSVLDGDPWLGLAGELSPSSEEPPVTPAPRPAGTSQNGSRKKSPRPPKLAKSTRAPVLTAGAPRQERLRLVSGPHGCAGRLEVWHGGRWGTVCDDGWDLRDAAVACRELGCGGALAAPGGARFGPGAGPVWMDDVGCGGGEQTLRDCPRSPWGRSNCDHSEDAGLVCTGPAPRLRLADGPHGCAGRLEVWHGGRWGTVCDDGWDLRDAAVACRELGCGGALAAPGGAFFGEGAGPILLDDLRCRGNETALRFCPARPWGQHDCHHREDAGAVCDGMPLGYVPPTAPAAGSNSSGPRGAASRPPPPMASQAPRTPGVSAPPALPTALQEPGPDAGSPQLRLVAGPSRCSGRLEVWHAGRWGTVCDDGWDLRDAAVVCRELGCGGPRQPDPTAGRFGWGAGPIWLDDVKCAGTEAALTDCPAAPWGKHNCAHNEDVGVTCTGTPGLDSISDPFSWSWIPSLGRDPDAWLPGELATKPSARRTPSVPEKTTTKAPGKMPKSTKKWVAKNAKRPTTQPLAMPTTKHSRVLGTQSPPELTSRTTTSSTPATGASQRLTSEFTTRLTTEAPHRLTSHTTATRTSRAPRERTSKTVATPTTQGPRLVTSEATTEPSAELPGQGSPESSTDPAPSPTSAAGPFRVRLADGPNRCAGRLEVWHAGRWGTVCDDGWDLRDGMVACWELGCGRIRPRVGKTHYGPGTGPIWLDDVGCKGSESSLSDCPARAWGQHNCDHEEDVGLTCTGYADEEDYPPWTWDPTSGEDLAKGTTAAGVPGHTLSRETTGSPGAPAPATRRLPSTGDKGCREPSQTGDTPSGGVPAKETPTAATPGPPGTTRSSGHPSLAPRLRGDTGSPRRPWPERRLRPTTARTAPAAPSPAPSAAPGSARPPLTSARPPLTSASAPPLTRTAASTPEATPDAPSAVQPSPAAASRGSTHRTSTSPSLTGPSPDAAAAPAPTSGLSPTPPPTAPKELTSDPSAPAAATRLSPTSGLIPELDRAPGRGTSPQPSSVPEPSSSPDRSTGPHPTTAPYSTMTSHPTTAPYSTMTSHPAVTSHPTTAPYSTMTSHPAATSHPTTAPYSTMTSHSAVTSHPTTAPYSTMTSHPAATSHPTTAPYFTMTSHPAATSHPTTIQYSTMTSHHAVTSHPTTAPYSTMTSHPTATSHPTTTLYPTATPRATTTPHPTTTPYPTTTPHPTVTSHPTTALYPTSTPHATTTPYPTTTPQSTSTPHPTATPAPITTAQSTTTSHPTTTFHPIMTPHPATIPHPTTTPHAATTPHPTTTPHPITTPYPATTPHLTTTTYRSMTPDLTSAPVVTAKSILTSLETEPPSPSPVKPSLHPQLTFMGPHHPSTSPASESSLSPVPGMDILSTENFKPATSQSPQVTSPPTQTPPSAPDSTVTPVGSSGDHLTPMAHPLDQPPPDHLSLGPAPSPSSGPLGPCEVPVPPVRVMACEPPALVELVAAVRDVGSQLQRLNQALERDQQERRALGLGLTQLVEAAQGLGQLGEVVKRLAEVAWPPTTPVPTTTTPEWEERPLRGDV